MGQFSENFKVHREKKYGKNVPIKEKLLSGQKLLSSHFTLKKSSEQKKTRRYSEEYFIEEEEDEDKAQEDIIELMVKIDMETKQEIKQQLVDAKQEILTAIKTRRGRPR